MRHLLIITYCLTSFFLCAQIDSTTIKIHVSTDNLSEDFSVVSSKTDELMLLIYESPKKSESLTDPVYVKSFHFNERSREISDDWNVLEKQGFLFFLLEMDTEKTVYQIDPIIRVYYQEIISSYKKRDYLGVEKYLGYDDVLGYAYFDIPSNHSIKGVYKLDKFDYTVTFQDQIN